MNTCASTTSATFSNNQRIYVAWYGENDTANWEEFRVDVTDYPNPVTWNGWWVTVQTAGTSVNLEFRCIDNPIWENPITTNYAPLCEECEVAPKEFARFIERLGEDDAYVKVQALRQQELFEHEEIRGMWEPKILEKIEADRVKMQKYLDLAAEEERKILLDRWGVESLPPMTPELLDQIAVKSREFLTQFLSPSELEMFVKDNHIKIQSQLEPDVVYIVKKGAMSQIEKWKDGKHTENLCYISAWSGLPHDDTLAMRIFDLKHNEAEVLKVANHLAGPRS